MAQRHGKIYQLKVEFILGAISQEHPWGPKVSVK